MALRKNIILNNGLAVENAYIRIDTVSGYKGGIDISINSYISNEAYNNGQEYLVQKFEHFVPSVENDAPNFIKQGYFYLKTLPNYSNAIDC